MYIVYCGCITGTMDNLAHLIQDKYDGDASKVTREDRDRLASGEPLAYIIGWIPFLGLRIGLGSRPLIPRPETEWWTERLIERLKGEFGDRPFSLLDLCAGSGAIGLAVLKEVPHAKVSFGEIRPEHCRQIRENLSANGLDASRADIRESDLFAAFDADARWDIIAANPPYVPDSRTLEDSVSGHEPAEALFAGSDGLSVIRKIAEESPQLMAGGGELWLEADIGNVADAKALLETAGAARAEILTDHYDRQRVVVSYYP
jgi:release factor glutamine methyltransferase